MQQLADRWRDGGSEVAVNRAGAHHACIGTLVPQTPGCRCHANAAAQVLPAPSCTVFRCHAVGAPADHGQPRWYSTGRSHAGVSTVWLPLAEAPSSYTMFQSIAPN